MADGTTGTLALALPDMIQGARLFEEYEMMVPKTFDRTNLPRGQGNIYNEIRTGQIVAQGITETTVNDNAQLAALTLFSVTPSMSQVMTRMTDKTFRRLSGNVAATLGRGSQLAMNRKLDQDCIAQFATAGTTLCGTGAVLNGGHISAAVANIRGNATETGMNAGPIHASLHPFGIKYLQDEILQGVGTYNVQHGLTEEFYKRGFNGSVAGANVWSMGNIAIDSTPDARGAVYAQKAFLLVRELELKTETRRRPDVGGGADEVFMTGGWAAGKRSDNWLRGILHGATAPTS